jgi:hypothetical protein
MLSVTHCVIHFTYPKSHRKMKSKIKTPIAPPNAVFTALPALSPWCLPPLKLQEPNELRKVGISTFELEWDQIVPFIGIA